MAEKVGEHEFVVKGEQFWRDQTFSNDEFGSPRWYYAFSKTDLNV